MPQFARKKVARGAQLARTRAVSEIECFVRDKRRNGRLEKCLARSRPPFSSLSFRVFILSRLSAIKSIDGRLFPVHGGRKGGREGKREDVPQVSGETVPRCVMPPAGTLQRARVVLYPRYPQVTAELLFRKHARA